MCARILVTGAAGFIGYHLSMSLLAEGHEVAGFDNLNDYYEVSLKEYRLSRLRSIPGFRFTPGDLADESAVNACFAEFAPEIVVNLAAQAGVRYSITNPAAYISSNIVGFFHVLEACRHGAELCGARPRHLVYASSSSVYGNQTKTPFSVDDPVDRPVSLYAATKKADELMAYTYAHLYGLPVTGLRFFTVYGPAGRPDMAYFSFTRKILAGEPIHVFGGGEMYRDFTYVDDIVKGIKAILPSPPEGEDPARVYNIGNNRPEKLMHFIETLEGALSRAYGRPLCARKEFLPMQPGDVYQTYADVTALERDFGFRPDTPIEDGLAAFANWYREYYG